MVKLSTCSTWEAKRIDEQSNPLNLLLIPIGIYLIIRKAFGGN